MVMASLADGRTTPALVFDVGQVLLGWQPLELLRRVLPKRASDAEQAQGVKDALFGAHFAGGEWARFDRGQIETESLIEAIAARLGWPPADVAAVVHAIPPALAPHAPLVDALQRLAERGLRLYFLSNMPAPYADWLEAQHPWFGRVFAGGLWSGREGLAKPDAAFYRRLAAAHGLHDGPASAPQRVHFFDDHGPNLHTAAALGWHTHHVVGPPATLARLQALHLLD